MLFPFCAPLTHWLACLNAKFLCLWQVSNAKQFSSFSKEKKNLFFFSLFALDADAIWIQETENENAAFVERSLRCARVVARSPFFLYRIQRTTEIRNPFYFSTDYYILDFWDCLREWSENKNVREPASDYTSCALRSKWTTWKMVFGKSKNKTASVASTLWNTVVEWQANARYSSAEIFIFCWLLNLHLDRLCVHVSRV